MYRFEAEDKDSGAPVYIEFNDHMIEPAAAEHFHIRMSNESFDAIVDPENSWPTFFPADMTGEEICEHMKGMTTTRTKTTSMRKKRTSTFGFL